MQAYEHWKFCQKIKRNKYKLFTSNKNFLYIPLVNSIGWILIGRMHQDILAIPYKIKISSLLKTNFKLLKLLFKTK